MQTLKHLTGLFAEPVATTTAQQHVEASASLRPEGARDKERERERENQLGFTRLKNEIFLLKTFDHKKVEINGRINKIIINKQTADVENKTS